MSDFEDGFGADSDLMSLPGDEFASTPFAQSMMTSSAPPPAPAGMSVPVTVIARTLQQTLVSKGFSVGAAGADNDFGPSSQIALRRALTLLSTDRGFIVSSDKHSVTMSSTTWTALQALPNRSAPRAPTTTGRDPTAAPAPVILPVADSGPSLLPWIIGGSVLAAIGLYLYFTPSKPKVTANRRRRHKRHGRRRS